MHHGLLLINLGTPDEPTTPAVRRYLREFLGDPRVIDINAIGRALLLNLVILPRRPARSAEAYRTIWDPERGSPLLYHSQDLARAVAERLGAGWRVELAMRYGKPAIADALAALEAAGVDRIVVLPLFPQYAASSTGTAVARVMELAQQRWNVPALDFVPAFFDDEGFLGAFAKVAAPVLADFRQDHLLFSFHGLPVRQIVKTDATASHCFKSASCCDSLTNPNCYRAQSFATARGIARHLGLSAESYTVGFQSRLGRTPWIQPYTDVLLDELPARGVRRLAVMCPAFVADCLETLEEIGMRARAQWKAAGGEELVLVPSLNAHPAWVDCVVGMAERHAARKALPTVA
jgi:protoporphyrin/coproporphyrin ferrochelatase